MIQLFTPLDGKPSSTKAAASRRTPHTRLYQPPTARRRSQSALPRVCQKPLPLVALSHSGTST
ncbi:MAG: hypothetical protein IJQ39_07290 [Thermoguttaceae bacterium]|nr:hypothetical protein [Thermoguttaceae bacterium]